MVGMSNSALGLPNGMTTAGSDQGNALDYTDKSHSSNNCSYPEHVKNKFYEYVAILEMIYLLSTDENARKELAESIDGSAIGLAVKSSAYSYTAGRAAEGAGTQLIIGSILDLFGADETAQDFYNRADRIEKQAEQLFDDAQKYREAAAEKFHEYFSNLWAEIKKRYNECGWFFAVATVGTDLVLDVGTATLTAGVGGVLLKGMKFVASRVGNKVKVRVIGAINGAKLIRIWGIDDLEAKYGKPEQNHAGTIDPEANHQIADGPAEGMANRKKKTENDSSEQNRDKQEDTENDTSAVPPPKTMTDPRVQGKNTNNITYDTKTGRPTRAQGVLKQDFGSTKRGDNATTVGKMGNPGDQGGHLVGHRFMKDTPDHGIAPQASNLNQGAWKTMENEWADWIKKGYNVEYDIKVVPPGAVRPDAFDVKYKVVDPKTGEVKYKKEHPFENKKGETFKRILFREMN